MRVTVPDDILDPYLAQADQTGRTVDEVVSAQLKRFRDLPVAHRAVVLSRTQCEALEPLLGQGQLRTGKDLVERVERLAGITFHHIRLDFTPSQLAELEHRAARQGRPVEELASDIIRQLTEQFFWGTAGGPAGAPAEPAQVGG